MKNRRLVIALGVIAAAVAVGIAGRGVAGRAAALKREADPVAQKFFALCRARDYARAHALLSPAQRERLSEPVLRERWRQFEKSHGPLRSWERAVPRVGLPAPSVNLWPPAVELVYLARGARSHSAVQIRLAPHEGSWRLDKVNILR